METREVVLEYFRVVLTAPVLFSIITGIAILAFGKDIKNLLSRVATIRFPGGTEINTPQSVVVEDESKPMPAPTQDPIQGMPSGLTPEQQATTEQLVRSYRASAYLWEYRYLNYYLVRGTQVVLDWLIELAQPTNRAHYDAVWTTLIPSTNERNAIIAALDNHHLADYDEVSEMITVTPKGREYQAWRGELPPPTST